MDVPFSITGNLAQEVLEENGATLSLEVVRRQAKLEPPPANLAASGAGIVVTMFAEITIPARTTTLQTANPISARLQIAFGDSAAGCP